MTLPVDEVHKTYPQAITYLDRAEKLVVVQSEIESLQQHHVSDIIPRTPDINTISLK